MLGKGEMVAWERRDGCLGKERWLLRKGEMVASERRDGYLGKEIWFLRKGEMVDWEREEALIVWKFDALKRNYWFKCLIDFLS